MEHEYNNSGLEQENYRLKQELETLKSDVQKYKVLADTFEKKFVEAQVELNKRTDEIASMKATCWRRNPGQRSRVLHCVKACECISFLLEETHYREHLTEETMKRLFVGGLSPSTTKDSLRDYFSRFGEITDATVMVDSNTHKSRGFGFVKFSEMAMVDMAQAARPHTIDGKVVDTKRAVTRAESNEMQATVTGKVKRIFIGGLRVTTTEMALKEYFSKFGDITHVNLFEDRETKMRKGFAYVTFDDYDTVDKVCQQRFHNIDDRRVEVKRATSKAERMQGRMANNEQSQHPHPTYHGPSTPGPNPYYDSHGNSYAAPPSQSQMWGGYGSQSSGGQGGYSGGPGGYSGGPGGYSGGPGGYSSQGWGSSQQQGGGHSSWSNGGGSSWGPSSGYGPSPSSNESRMSGGVGPMRGGGRFSERSAGPYGGNYGNYGSMGN